MGHPVSTYLVNPKVYPDLDYKIYSPNSSLSIKFKIIPGRKKLVNVKVSTLWMRAHSDMSDLQRYPEKLVYKLEN